MQLWRHGEQGYARCTFTCVHAVTTQISKHHQEEGVTLCKVLSNSQVCSFGDPRHTSQTKFLVKIRRASWSFKVRSADHLHPTLATCA